MRYRWAALLAVLVLGSVASAAGAATRYVSDQLEINMRRGPGTGYRIARLLEAGDKLQTLSAAKGWTEVRTGDGATGYVLTRFLSDQPAARRRIEPLQKQNFQLAAVNAQLKNELAQIPPDLQAASQRQKNLIAKNHALQGQLKHIREVAADAIRIDKQNRRYRVQLLSLRSDLDRLRHENQTLDTRREGLKIGALILIACVIVGLLWPLLRRRKNSWG